MKALIVKTGLFLVLFVSGNILKAQVYEKADMVVDAYYGFPNLYTAAVKTIYSLAPEFNVDIQSFGPIGLRYEYLLSHRFGVGVNANYAYSGIEGTFTAYDFTTEEQSEFEYEATVTRLRIMPTFFFHMDTSKWIDPYFSLAIGYGGRSFKESSNYPFVPPLNFDKSIPIAYRGEFGTRFFFTDNIGAHLQFGIGGGPLLGLGLSGKF